MGAKKIPIIIALMSVLGLSLFPISASAGGLGVSCDYLLQKHADQYMFTLRVYNSWGVVNSVEHPANRQVLSFALIDELGNFVAPTGIAKADPLAQKLTIPPNGKSEYTIEFRASEAFPFLTGSAKFAYSLDKLEKYRLIVIYRPLGFKHEGLICGGSDWREVILDESYHGGTHNRYKAIHSQEKKE